MKATVTFEDDGDEVKISIDFGEQGGVETSGAHQMALLAAQLVLQHVGSMQPSE